MAADAGSHSNTSWVIYDLVALHLGIESAHDRIPVAAWEDDKTNQPERHQWT